jgi:hypothetical protein
MNTPRRVIFALLVVGCLTGMVESLGLRPPNLLASSTLFLIGLGAPFGLLIWSFIFLEREKLLTRIALVIIFIFMLAQCIVIARAPG